MRHIGHCASLRATLSDAQWNCCTPGGCDLSLTTAISVHRSGLDASLDADFFSCGELQPTVGSPAHNRKTRVRLQQPLPRNSMRL